MTMSPTSRPPADSAQDLAAWREAAQALAQEAARMIREAIPSESWIEKAPGDWCSALDAAVEQHLRQRLAERFPDHGFFGEEGHAQPFAPDNAHTPVWVVDPIDGSANFIRGYPQYAISIAAVRGGEPVAGCILDPVRGECFSAALGQGADCNGQPLAVSRTPALLQGLAGTVFPKPGSPLMAPYLRELESALRQCGGVRRSGSMALELAYLAAGRLDVFWERGMGPWDAAAGLLLVREAGGEVWALDGLPWWRSQALAAATPTLRADWGAMWPGDPKPA